MSKTARKIIDYCLENNIGTLVCGYNETFQRNSNIGKANNQTFVNIPFGKLREKLEYLCKLYGLIFVEQEESYTSKSSFFDMDILPKFEADDSQNYSFSGKRIKRRNLDKNHALAIDFGINNLATCVTSKGKSFIIDGKKLKSINQWFNKENARLQSIKDKQKYGKKPTLRQKYLYASRNNKVNDYMSKTARKIIDYCLENNIGTLVCGYNETFQRNSNIGKANNQTFVNIPFGKLREKLEYLCKLYGLIFVEQEESYTSKSSFFDMDILPKFEADDSQNYSFSGKRIKRGLYQTSKGYIFNADVNGVLNILRKSNVVDLEVLYTRGAVDTPERIRIA